MHIQDNSGDHKYFTMIPNYILNHSTLYDREVYIQMKRFSGEKGTCWASRKTLAERCGVSPRRVDKSIKYLLDHKWISLKGKKRLKTVGGNQSVNEYSISDLWKMNINFYDKGVAPNAIPKWQRGSTDRAKGVAPGAHKEEPEEKKKDTSSLGAKEPTADEIQRYNEISKGIKDLLKGKRI